MEIGAELLVFFADFGELSGDGLELSGDGYYARDGGSEDGKHGVLPCSDGLEGMRGVVLY